MRELVLVVVRVGRGALLCRCCWRKTQKQNSQK
jgi:hypothetical protein